MLVRSSSISSRISGSIFAASAMLSCAIAGSDYFENSRQATYLQRDYAIRNPKGFSGYGENCWGITASDGPGPAKRSMTVGGRRFFGYLARGAPFGPDDGTLSPWAAISLIALCARDRSAGTAPFSRNRPPRGQSIRVHRKLQSDNSRRRRSGLRLGIAASCRHQSGADCPDDREFPIGVPVATDAARAGHHQGIAPSRFFGRLVVSSVMQRARFSTPKTGELENDGRSSLWDVGYGETYAQRRRRVCLLQAPK